MVVVWSAGSGEHEMVVCCRSVFEDDAGSSSLCFGNVSNFLKLDSLSLLYGLTDMWYFLLLTESGLNVKGYNGSVGGKTFFLIFSGE